MRDSLGTVWKSCETTPLYQELDTDICGERIECQYAYKPTPTSLVRPSAPFALAYPSLLYRRRDVFILTGSAFDIQLMRPTERLRDVLSNGDILATRVERKK
jgi:hypothetical protein